MILDCASKSFNEIPRLFICLGQLRIIEYIQSQRTGKKSNMESFATIVNENGFIEKYPATPVDRFKGDLRPKTHPSFYVIILMILWKKSLVQSFVVF